MAREKDPRAGSMTNSEYSDNEESTSQVNVLDLLK